MAQNKHTRTNAAANLRTCHPDVLRLHSPKRASRKEHGISNGSPADTCDCCNLQKNIQHGLIDFQRGLV